MYPTRWLALDGMRASHRTRELSECVCEYPTSDAAAPDLAPSRGVCRQSLVVRRPLRLFGTCEISWLGMKVETLSGILTLGGGAN